MTIEVYLVAALAVTLTGISKAGFAGGLGMLSVPLVASFMPPQAAAVLLLPVLLAIDVISVWRYRKAWKVQTILVLLPGAVFGIVLGMWSFSDIDPDLLRVGVGVLALSLVGHHLLGHRKPGSSNLGLNGIKIFIASTLSGFAGFIAHAGGPPIKGTLLTMELDKTTFVATNSFFFFTLNLAKGVGYAALGLFSAGGLLNSLLLTPFLLLGVALGFQLHMHISQHFFSRLSYALLALAGLNLLFIGLPPFFSN